MVADPTHPQAEKVFRRWLARELLAESSWRRFYPGGSSPLIEAHQLARKQRLALNALAGFEAFPVMDYVQMTNWLLERLGVARCLADVPPQALDLAPLDPAQVTQIQTRSVSRRHISVSEGPDLGSLEKRSVRSINAPPIAKPTLESSHVMSSASS